MKYIFYVNSIFTQSKNTWNRQKKFNLLAFSNLKSKCLAVSIKGNTEFEKWFSPLKVYLTDNLLAVWKNKMANISINMSVPQSALCISQSIVEAVERDYMHNNRADHGFHGT